MAKQQSIYWQSELIGYLEDYQLDMWYVEGTWIALDNDFTKDFLKKYANHSFEDFQNMKDGSEVIWLGLDENKPNHLFVAFIDGKIVLRTSHPAQRPESW